MSVWKRRLTAVVVAALTSLSVSLISSGAHAAPADEEWSSAWTSSQVQPSEFLPSEWALDGFADHSVRQVIKPTVDGDTARITVSNEYGDRPLEITGATIGATESGADIAPGTLSALRFDGAASTEVPPGERLVSDPVQIAVTALRPVTVTFYLAEETGPATFHYNGYSTTYRADGDHSTEDDGAAFTETEGHWFYLTDLDVMTSRDNGVLAFGDSITNGSVSLPDEYNTYPDVLAERLSEAGDSRAVLNSGVSGNRLVTDSAHYGDRAAVRFDRDALDKPGIGTVIIMLGTNDIGFSDLDDPQWKPNPEVSAEEIIAEHSALIERARDADLRVVGGTITPYKGYEAFTPRGEEVRDTVNEWILESGAYDTVVDFAQVLASPDDEEALNPAFDSGDHLHPNDAGFQAMAEAIDLSEL